MNIGKPQRIIEAPEPVPAPAPEPVPDKRETPVAPPSKQKEEVPA